MAKLGKTILQEWRAPIVFFVILILVLYYLYGGIPFEKTTVIDYVPLIISIGIVALMAYCRRLNEAYREFMTPGNVIFWGVIITAITYIIWLGLT